MIFIQRFYTWFNTVENTTSTKEEDEMNYRLVLMCYSQ
jgi:hypothetical protein